MKQNYFKIIALFLFSISSYLQLEAQDLYLFEDFNECELPQDWRATVNGESAVWGVGISGKRKCW